MITEQEHELAEIIYNTNIIEGWKNVSLKDCQKRAKDYYYIKSLVNDNLPLHHFSDTLLSKYIEHVSQCEGVDLIDKCNSYSSDVKFTEEEIKTLERLV